MQVRKRKAQINKRKSLSDEAHVDLRERLQGVLAQEPNGRRKRNTRDDVHKLRGSLKGKGLLKALVAEKKKEREL